MDAPLASETTRFVGDAIVSSIIGYDDPAWAIRNSATMVFASTMLRVIDADKNASAKDVTSGNAITARELFRTYPGLPPFLLAVLKDGVEDMMSPAHRIAVPGEAQNAKLLSRVLHPSLYPILLLLSRLQSVETSISDGQQDDFTKPFVETIIQCLPHRHHKVRLVAARALSALCSGDGAEAEDKTSRKALIQSCLDLLSNSTGREQIDRTDWNAVHGSLLGIQALLRSSKDPSSFIADSRLIAELNRYSSWCWGSCECPPSCTAIALEIVADAGLRTRAEMSGSGLDERMALALSTTSYELVRLVEHISRDCQSTDLIGLASLSQVASRTACTISMKVVFGLIAADDATRSTHLENLGRLFASDSFEVRYQAVKAFKKPLCEAVDRILSATSVLPHERLSMLEGVAEIIIRSLSFEVRRRHRPLTSANQMDQLSHSPTLRRLSRCAIECLYGCDALTDTSQVPLPESVDVDNFWEVCLELYRCGCKELETHYSRGTSATSLSGNALELMGVLVSTMLTDDAYHSGNAVEEKIDNFVGFVREFNNSEISWRVRHSAARALETCQILKWVPQRELEDREHAHVDFFRHKQLDLHMEAFKFLQDSDVDVRRVTGRALLESAHVQEMSATTPIVTLAVLEESFLNVCERFGGPELTERLLNVIIDTCCRPLRSSLRAFLKEVKQSEGLPVASELLNLSSERKIFEDEEPNSFEEVSFRLR